MKTSALVVALLLACSASYAQQEGGGGEETDSYCRIRSMIHCNSQCNPSQQACLGLHPEWTDFCNDQYAICYAQCLDDTVCGFTVL